MTFVETCLATIIDTDQNVLAVGVHAEGIHPMSLGTVELVGGIALLEE